MGDHFSLYMSPINLDPEKPAMPVSHPPYYSMYLAKRIGPYATLGLAEDTWALNEGVTDEGIFLQQTYDIDRERQDMFFAALDRLRNGHAGVRLRRDRSHPAHVLAVSRPRAPGATAPTTARIRTPSADLYRHNDALVGRVMQQLGADDVLMVVSDHGFNSFRRGVNLNSWLQREGYLALKPGSDAARRVASRRGLVCHAGLLGRPHGHVSQPRGPGSARHRRAGRGGRRAEGRDHREAHGLRDAEKNAVAIREAFDTAHALRRPVRRERAGSADRLQRRLPRVVGRRHGNRRRARVRRQHQGVERRSLHRSAPGARRFFCNRSIKTSEPALIDIAPTALRLFGIEPPAYMDGRPLAGLV